MARVNASDSAWEGKGALVFLAALAAIAFWGLPVLNTAPNRLVAGEGVHAVDLLRGPVAVWAGAIGASAVLLLALIGAGHRRGLWMLATVTALLIPALLWLLGRQAEWAAQTGSALARTSLASGFWVVGGAWALLLAQALQHLAASRAARTGVAVAAASAVVSVLASGACDALSLIKEFHARADVLWPALHQHALLVASALALTLALGLPLGWGAYQSGRVRGVVMPVLNVAQTIPSIALFGLLIAPLTWLADALPALGQAGLSGVGLVPAVVALTLYGLLPVVRGTEAGLAHVPPGLLDAGRSIGLSPAQSLRWVAFPLALPVVLAGIRTAAVQQVGLAVVAALIGAGGLGTVLFDGLFSAAQDVVLLGVLPVVVLGALVDAAFSATISATRAARVQALTDSPRRAA